MRNKIKIIDLTLILLFIFSFSYFIYSKLSNNKHRNLNKLKVTKIKLSFDTTLILGKIKKDNIITFNGFLRNIGSEKLYIKNYSASCGCTNFYIKNLKLDPLDSTEIKFSLKPEQLGINKIYLKFEANTEQKNHRIIVDYMGI